MESGSTAERARARYQDAAVAEEYDSWRYETPRGRRRNRRDLAAIGRALDEAARRGGTVATALDIPCGTGRLAPLFRSRGIRAAGADVALEMMAVARRKHGPLPLFQCDVAAIPCRDASLDCVFAIRFVFHLDGAARSRAFAEIRRVTRRWAVIDIRHRYNLRWLGWRIRHAAGLLPGVQHRFSREGLEKELREAGFALAGVYPSRRVPWVSDKWTVLAERVSPPPG